MKLFSKHTIAVILLSTLTAFCSKGQTDYRFGLGYFGELGVHPGLVLGMEIEHHQTDRFSLVPKINLGYYSHVRNHTAIFLEHQMLLRRLIGKRLFLESGIGVGVMLPILNEAVYKVDASGNVSSGKQLMNPDFMPSFNLGLGALLNPESESLRMVWIRPKMFWQYPYNHVALPHVAVQIGFSQTIKTK